MLKLTCYNENIWEYYDRMCTESLEVDDLWTWRRFLINTVYWYSTDTFYLLHAEYPQVTHKESVTNIQ